jgi:CRP/FNR family transcriptional regulator, anaerobic regulatory protein
MDELLQFLESLYRLSFELKDELYKVTKFYRVRKGEYLLRAGEVCRNMYFIRKGLLRCYYISVTSGKERTSWVLKEGDVVTAEASFYDQTESRKFIHALEDTDFFCIHFQDLEDIYKRFPEFNYVGRKLTIKYMLFFIHHFESVQMTTAKERFDRLMLESPDLFLRVPRNYLASYLGMTRETFSRMQDSA